MDDSSIWFDYPPELLVEADAQRDAADQALLEKPTCDPDPYNISLFQLIARWFVRMTS